MTKQSQGSFVEWTDGPPSPLWTDEEWTRAWRLIDIKVQELILRHGPGKTISYVAAQAAQAGDAVSIALCALLDVIDPGHCRRALGEKAGPLA